MNGFLQRHSCADTTSSLLECGTFYGSVSIPIEAPTAKAKDMPWLLTQTTQAHPCMIELRMQKVYQRQQIGPKIFSFCSAPRSSDAPPAKHVGIWTDIARELGHHDAGATARGQFVKPRGDLAKAITVEKHPRPAPELPPMECPDKEFQNNGNKVWAEYLPLHRSEERRVGKECPV